MKSEYEEYLETCMIGAYHPERAFVRNCENGVMTTYRDCDHQMSDSGFVWERFMVVNDKPYLVTSMFPMNPTATPTEKMLSYIDSELAKDAKSTK